MSKRARAFSLARDLKHADCYGEPVDVDALVGKPVAHAIYLDSFSGSLSELRCGQRTVQNALRVLAKDPRVSSFERGERWLESLLADLQAHGLVVEDAAEPYPWHRFRLTDAGSSLLDGCNDSFSRHQQAWTK